MHDKKILLVADCTGHGVPGAFMTLIGNTVMDKIVKVWEITNPAEILTKLHTEIKTVLRQDDTQNNSGMDANIASWQTDEDGNIQMVWAGAKQDVYYVPKGTKKIQCLKATRKAIGGEQNEKISFQNETIILPKGSFIFSGSDGLPDQNDKARKRFGEDRIISILEENINQPFEHQKNQLLQALDTHTQGTAQRDDILWIGVGSITGKC